MSVSKLSLSILDQPIHIEQIWGATFELTKLPISSVFAAKILDPKENPDEKYRKCEPQVFSFSLGI